MVNMNRTRPAGVHGLIAEIAEAILVVPHLPPLLGPHAVLVHEAASGLGVCVLTLPACLTFPDCVTIPLPIARVNLAPLVGVALSAFIFTLALASHFRVLIWHGLIIPLAVRCPQIFR